MEVFREVNFIVSFSEWWVGNNWPWHDVSGVRARLLSRNARTLQRREPLCYHVRYCPVNLFVPRSVIVLKYHQHQKLSQTADMEMGWFLGSPHEAIVLLWDHIFLSIYEIKLTNIERASNKIARYYKSFFFFKKKVELLKTWREQQQCIGQRTNGSRTHWALQSEANPWGPLSCLEWFFFFPFFFCGFVRKCCKEDMPSLSSFRRLSSVGNRELREWRIATASLRGT